MNRSLPGRQSLWRAEPSPANAEARADLGRREIEGRRSGCSAVVIAVVASWLLAASGCAGAGPQDEARRRTSGTGDPGPADGVYLVHAISTERSDLDTAAAPRAFVLMHDRRYALGPGDEPRAYFLVGPVPDVLLRPSRPAKTTRADDGRTVIQIELDAEQAAKLEALTRENVGATAAVVVGGEVLNAPVIRAPVAGGRLMITDCSDEGVRRILAALPVAP